jgi:hypothetical protein
VAGGRGRAGRRSSRRCCRPTCRRSRAAVTIWPSWTGCWTGRDYALRLYRDLTDRYYESDTLTHLGDTHLAVGDPDAARAAWRQALTILDDLDHPDAQNVRAKLHHLRGA